MECFICLLMLLIGGIFYFDYSPGSSVQIKFNTYTAPSENLKINGGEQTIVIIRFWQRQLAS